MKFTTSFLKANFLNHVKWRLADFFKNGKSERIFFTDEVPDIPVSDDIAEIDDDDYMKLKLAREFISGLSEDRKRVMEMIALELETKEIARKTGIPLGTIYSHVFHARKALNAHIDTWRNSQQ